MKRLLFGLMLLASPVLAQEAVPLIPFDGSDPLKPPKDLYLGEVTGVAVEFEGSRLRLSRGNTTGPPTAAAGGAGCSSSRPTGVRSRDRQEPVRCRVGHTVRVDPSDKHLDHGQGSTWWSSSTPGPRCDGVRAQAGGIGQGNGAAGTPQSAAAS